MSSKAGTFLRHSVLNIARMFVIVITLAYIEYVQSWPTVYVIICITKRY